MSFEGIETYMQGAEARIYKINYLGQPCIVKERFVKSYRHPDLDKQLTKERIRSESRCILRCKEAGLRVPIVYLVDLDRRIIVMEDVQNSETVKKYLFGLSQLDNPYAHSFMTALSTEIGRIIAKMHSNNLVHGDLTTSNMLIKYDDDNTNWHLFMIDFGLSFSEATVEDKAVDIYVLERALVSTHSNIDEFFKEILLSYSENYKESADILRKYEEVRARGRKRAMIG